MPLERDAAGDPGESELHDWSRPVRIESAWYLSDSARMPRRLRVPPVRPRSARYVASLWWSWAPAHDRVDHLYLSLDRTRKHYLLWFEWAEDGYSESRAVAFMPRAGADSRVAARAMVHAFYSGVEREFQSEEGRWHTAYPGLLSPEELEALASGVWPVAEGEMRKTTDARLGPILDELILAEVALRREGQRAISGCVLGIGSAFLRAAESLDRCSATICEQRGDSRAAGHARATAARNALLSLGKLESFLSPQPDRFQSLKSALGALAELRED